MKRFKDQGGTIKERQARLDLFRESGVFLSFRQVAEDGIAIRKWRKNRK